MNVKGIMEGHIFVGILEDWLRGLAKGSGGEQKSCSTSQATTDTMLQPEDFQLFKSWFSLALRTTEVWSGDISLSPEDVVFSTAVKRTHTKLIKALSMFTDKELLDIFGPERANQIRGIANEVSYVPVSTGTMFVQTSVKLS